MKYAIKRRGAPSLWAAVALFLFVAPVGVTAPNAQAAASAVPAAPANPRSVAPIDLTGYWVSVVTEDWRLRMITPDKGDLSSLPLNPEAKRVAGTWGPDKDIAAGNQCRSYGVGG